MYNIYFRRALKVAVHDYDENSSLNFAEVASFDANLRKLGYAINAELAERLLHAPVSEIKRIHDAVISEAKEIKGVRRYSPMYPNFPRQVMEASEAELYLNAIAHYFGTAIGVRIMPVYDKLARVELDFDESKFKIVGLGSFEDFDALMASLMISKSAFSETDKADLESLDSTRYGNALSRVSVFANRENKAWLANQSLVRGLNIAKFTFDTATDVLRLAVAMSGGDVSLAEPTKFRSFKRPERRLLLNTLEAVNGDFTEDMLRHAAAWKRLGERLHPGEFKGLKRVNAAFKVIRENGKVETFNSRVERLIAENDPLGASRVLVKRPGEFARRLDKVLRTNATGVQETILRKFSNVAPDASPTVLLQARNAFLNRDNVAHRTFFPKGSVAKMQTIKDERSALSRATKARAVDIFDEALKKAFLDRPELGKVYVDPALKGVAVPFGLRNASKGNVLGRGSRLPLADESNIVRFFIWWKDSETSSKGWGYGRHTDIDLSAACFDADFNYHSAITYYNLREQGAVHSGDITSAPNGASEFIDIDIETLRKNGVRYVAQTLHVYSGQTFDELPECFAGFMERQDLGSGEVYDPRTVTNKVDLTAKSRGATPFIFDLETREAVWVDLSMQIGGGYSNVSSTKGQIKSTVEAMVSLTPPNLYDLFAAHAAARGTLVSRDEADLVFAMDGDVTPFDVETILSEYL
jgi:hypothetical protein